MSKTQTTIVADSRAPSGVRLTTALLTYPTIIHQDILTHRTIYKLRAENGEDEWIELDANKSTNSNRAKPTKTVLREVWLSPFCPTRFPKRAVTMHSSRGYLTGWKHAVARFVWLKLRYIMMMGALILMCLPGVHKQIANRLLMPWTYTTLVMTAIEPWWDHFISLRAHYMAQDEVQEIAHAFELAYVCSVPQALEEGEWHLPFVPLFDKPLPERLAIKLSVARCARTSYAQTHEQMLDMSHARPLSEDVELFERLDVQRPEHAGPKEHQARAHSDPNHHSGTLVGWDQLRHTSVLL